MTEHVDVLIVGAGLSGIGAACRLRTEHPERSVAVLEAREASGGTWDLFRYPGIRSDSDMFTFGFKWRPWAGDVALADGPSILDYLRTVASEYGVDELIRYRHRVAGRQLGLRRRPVDRRGRPRRRARSPSPRSFLWACGGYYDYDRGYSPEFAGQRGLPRRDRAPPALARGPRLHGQEGRRDRLRRHRRDAGAGDGRRRGRARDDAAALADVRPLPARGATRSPRRLRRLPRWLRYRVVRWKAILASTLFFQLSRRRPEMIKGFDPQGRRQASCRRAST